MGNREYSKQELLSELGYDMHSYLSDIRNFEAALLQPGKFKLADRVEGLLTEMSIVKSDKSVESIIEESKANLEQKIELISDEIQSLQREADMCGNSSKFVGEGWAGQVAIFGDDLKDKEEIFLKYFEDKGKRGDLAEFWISDVVQSYVKRTNFNGELCLMEPQCEDFMIESIKK